MLEWLEGRERKARNQILKDFIEDVRAVLVHLSHGKHSCQLQGKNLLGQVRQSAAKLRVLHGILHDFSELAADRAPEDNVLTHEHTCHKEILKVREVSDGRQGLGVSLEYVVHEVEEVVQDIDLTVEARLKSHD